MTTIIVTPDDRDAAEPHPPARLPEPPVRAALGRLFVAPLMIWLALTIVLPLAYCIWISLTNANTMGGTPKFVGFANYAAIFGDGTFGPGNHSVRVVLGLADVEQHGTGERLGASLRRL